MRKDSGDAALSLASQRGLYDIVRLLLDKGADVQANLDDALRTAFGNGHYNIVQLLLDRGVDVDVEATIYRHNALSLAAREGHYMTVLLLLYRGAYATDLALLEASKTGHYDIVQLLNDKRAGLQTRLPPFSSLPGPFEDVRFQSPKPSREI